MVNEPLRTGSFSCAGAVCNKGARCADERLSRREFFRFGRLEAAVIPLVDREKCGKPEGCSLCAERCTARAIRLQSGEIRIDRTRCRGCGACTAACPGGALLYPGFSPDEMDQVIAGLLQGEEADLRARIIAFTCSEKNSDLNAYPENVAPLHIPCLAMVSPWTILRAFTLGAQGVILLPPGPGCTLISGNSLLQNAICFIRELFTAWSIEPSRIDLWSGTRGEMKEFAQAVKRLPVLRLTGIQAGPLREKGLPLSALIKAIEKTFGPSAAIGVGKGIAPFGIVRINPDRCTGCGLCGLNCPTGALTFSPGDKDDSYRVFFRHDRCAGCAVCRKSCPEKAIAVEQILQIAKLAQPAAVLFEDRFSSCSGCGAPLFPQAMVHRLKARLSAAGAPAWAVDLCPACRANSPILPGRSGEDRLKDITL